MPQVNAGLTGMLGTGPVNIPNSEALRNLLSDETGTGPAVFGTGPTITDPTVGGILTTEGAHVVTPNVLSVSANAATVHVGKMKNEVSHNANLTLSFSATPTTDARFGCEVNNTAAGPITVTIPTSLSATTQAQITSFVLPAGGTTYLLWNKKAAATPILYGESRVIGDWGSEVQVTVTGGSADLGAVNTASVRLDTGTSAVTNFGTATNGVLRFVRFQSARVLTHNATSLICPTAGDITTANGDVCIVQSLGSGNWRVVSYTRANGLALASTGGGGGGQMVPEIVTGTTKSITDAENNKILFFTNPADITVTVESSADGSFTDMAWLAEAGTISVVPASSPSQVTINEQQGQIVLTAAMGGASLVPTGVARNFYLIGAVGDLVAEDILDSTEHGRLVLTGPTPLDSRTAISAAARSQPGHGFPYSHSQPQNGDHVIIWRATHGGTITRLDGGTSGGQCNVRLKINSTLVGSGTTLMNASGGTATISTNNVFVEGDKIILTITNADTGEPANLSITAKYTRTLD